MQANRTIRVLLIAEHPWVYPTKGHSPFPQLAGHVGPFVNFWLDVVKHFPGADIHAFSQEALSSTANKTYPRSEAQAALYDVAIGNFDVAISPFWVMSKRLETVAFLPSIMTDDLYLLVKVPPAFALWPMPPCPIDDLYLLVKVPPAFALWPMPPCPIMALYPSRPIAHAPSRHVASDFWPLLAYDCLFFKVQEQSVPFDVMLAKPFRPFTWELWGWIGGSLFIIALVFVFTAATMPIMPCCSIPE